MNSELQCEGCTDLCISDLPLQQRWHQQPWPQHWQSAYLGLVAVGLLLWFSSHRLPPASLVTFGTGGDWELVRVSVTACRGLEGAASPCEILWVLISSHHLVMKGMTEAKLLRTAGHNSLSGQVGELGIWVSLPGTGRAVLTHLCGALGTEGTAAEPQMLCC